MLFKFKNEKTLMKSERVFKQLCKGNSIRVCPFSHEDVTCVHLCGRLWPSLIKDGQGGRFTNCPCYEISRYQQIEMLERLILYNKGEYEI